MHLVLLGAMHKLIHLWISKGLVAVRLHSRQIINISELLLSLRQFIPTEFARKPRSLSETLFPLRVGSPEAYQPGPGLPRPTPFGTPVSP